MNIAELKNDANFIRIPAAVMEYIEGEATAINQYVAWLEVIGADVIQRMFACRRYKGELQWTEVERQSVLSEGTVRRNIYETEMSGYRPVFEKTEVNGTYYGYPTTRFLKSWYNQWDYMEKPMGICYRLLNRDVLKSSDEFMYSGYEGSCGDCISYLKMYKENPKVEYFGRLGLVPKKSLLKKAEKDKQFVRFLIKNAPEINRHYYGPEAVLYAYKNKMSIKTAENELWLKREARKILGKTVTSSGIDILAAYRWARERHDIAMYSYRDYLEACIALGLNMQDTKVLYPRDFHRMHDLRINQYDSEKAKLERKEREKLKRDFEKTAKKYIPYECNGEKYAIVIPTSPADLRHEGKMLSHCVGRMGYDKKMAKGETVIAFVRKVEAKEDPFVTVEFKGENVLQCYGDHDSTPAADVREFVEKWVKNTSKKVKTAM